MKLFNLLGEYLVKRDVLPCLILKMVKEGQEWADK